MEAFISYFFSVNLLLLLLAVYYRLFLAKQPRFKWNRIFLLGGMVAALFLPMIRLDIVPPSLPNPSFIRTLPERMMGSSSAPANSSHNAVSNPVTSYYPGSGLGSGSGSSVSSGSGSGSIASSSPEILTTNASPASSTLSALDIAFAIYLIGVGIALIALLMRNLAILRLIWKGQKTRQEGYTLVGTTQDIGPASYFHYIFWNTSRPLDAQSTAVALAHERCHSRQLHSLDLLGIELLKAFCWINPAIYLLRKDLKETHEFLADQAAIQVAGPEGIKRLLLLQQLGAPHLLISNFFASHTKARIMKLSESSKRKTLLQYILIVPLAGLMAACTSLAHPMEGTSDAAVTANSVQTASTASSASSSAMTVDSARTPSSARTASGATTSDSVFVADAASAQSQEPQPEFFNIQDVLIRGTMPLPSTNPQEKGLVCLGRQPQVLNLDTILSLDELENVANHPQLLNRDRIMKLIGSPKDAKNQKIVGKVVVKLLVDETGHVIRHQYLKEHSPILRDAVEAHVNDLLFKPGKEDGKPTEWWVIMPFNFGMPGC